jgi:hypothetical protein
MSTPLVYQDVKMRQCWACRHAILDGEPAQWLAYEVPDQEPDIAVPMHAACAKQPWPMYPVEPPADAG